MCGSSWPTRSGTARCEYECGGWGLLGVCWLECWLDCSHVQPVRSEASANQQQLCWPLSCLWFLTPLPFCAGMASARLSCTHACMCLSCRGEMEAEGLMPELDELMQQLERKYGRQVSTVVHCCFRGSVQAAAWRLLCTHFPSRQRIESPEVCSVRPMTCILTCTCVVWAHLC